jgi:hypothetical protein
VRRVDPRALGQPLEIVDVLGGVVHGRHRH